MCVFTLGPRNRSTTSVSFCRRSQTAGKPDIRRKPKSRQHESPNVNQRATPDALTPSEALTAFHLLGSRQNMAELDGNTAPAAQLSGVRRPLISLPSELLPIEPAVFEAIHRLNSR